MFCAQFSPSGAEVAFTVTVILAKSMFVPFMMLMDQSCGCSIAKLDTCTFVTFHKTNDWRSLEMTWDSVRVR